MWSFTGKRFDRGKCAPFLQDAGAAASEARPARRLFRIRPAAWLPLSALLAPLAATAEAPPLPSSFYGSAAIQGAPAPEATAVSAWLGATELAATRTFSRAGVSSYRLDVPGDRADTPEIEGAVEGAAIELRLGGASAGTVLWHAGTYLPYEIAAGAGPDLRVALTDGVDAVSGGESVVYTISVANDGPGAAAGVQLRADLPASAALVAASDGGFVAAGELAWPAFELGELDTVSFTFTLAVASQAPAGVATFTTGATVAHDGAAGADPDPGDDQASDVDALLAAPDLAVAVSDGVASALPGSTLFARVTVANPGSQGATGVAVALDLPAGVEFYSASHGGVVVGDRVSWPAVPLAATATFERTATLRLPAGLDPGLTELLLVASAADDGANGADLDPSDNQASDLDGVTHGPDLVVDGVGTAGLTVDPDLLEVSGEAVVAIANRGTLAAGAFGLLLFSDVDGDGVYGAGADLALGATTVAGLAAGAQASASVAVAGAVRFRGDRLFAMVDPDLVWPELDETNNVGDSSRGCGAAPAAQPFAPRLELAWPPPGAPVFQPGSIDSLSTPLVVQLTDDNGDGLWDERDVPDLVFVTTNLYELMEPQIYLRAIRGDSGAAIFDVDGFLPHPTAPTAFSFSGLAAGDIDGDGKPELVTTTFGPFANNTLVALEHNGVRKWQSAVYHTHPSPTGLSNRDNPTIADLDADGHAEIVVGANVFDRFGHLLWRGAAGQAFQSSGNGGDRGGAISAVADVDLDGRLEVVTGNTLYRHDGSILWQVPLADGYPAVADFDGDPQAEIVVVARGTVRLHDTDGTLLWGPVELPGSDPEAGGAPTVADFDGDGAPEIGVAGSDVYVVIETDGTLRWQASTQDYTSNLTGSTVFDLDGDGSFEAIYRDERRLRIYRGSDGAVLFEDVLSSNTWTEEPVVADVDRDGNAEIVVTSDRAPDVPMPGGERTAGLRVYGDAGDGWTWARAIWNQHAYTPEQVEDDAGIPARPGWSWLAHNTFRANLPPAGDGGAAPNLTASRLRLDLAALPALRITVRVGNGGRTPVGPGLPVAVYDGDPGAGGAVLGVLAVPGRLAPGEYVDLSAELAAPELGSGSVTVAVDDDGTGAGRERECDESDNATAVAYDSTALGLWIRVDDGTPAVAPGEEVVYVIEVRNAFAGTASGVVVTDTLPPDALFLGASDGGVASAGVVSWPATSLPSGGRMTRTLTLRVAPELPPEVSEWSNQAAVSDDGAQGPDPSPWNNVAADVDAIVAISADAGGPYSAVEGETIQLDGSGSFARDGTIVAYAWDLDGDGAFDDGSGPVLALALPDEGAYPVALRVADDGGEIDTDRTSVTVSNGAPGIAAPELVAADEGAALGLGAIAISDPGPLDALSATVDWGDGSAGTVAVVAGTLAGSHTYVDDGLYAIDLCVGDGDGGESCAALGAQVANAAPAIGPSRAFDFQGWQVRELGAPASTLWNLSADGRTVTEHLNGEPALLVGDFPAYGRYELALRVADIGDDDFVGLAFGVDPVALGTADADFLLLDWKRGDQSGARRGLALSRVHGAPSTTELWLHVDQAANGAAHRVEELARGATRGTSGWARHTEYRVRIEHAPNRLRVWIDDTLEFDQSGAFPAGSLALYDYSQANAVFTAIESALVIGGTEGTAAALRAIFTDPGVADLHTAEVDWGDGVRLPAPVAEEGGRGEVATGHVYLDDGERTAILCVADGDGGEGCAAIPARVGNAPPALALSVASSGYRQDPVRLDGSTFTDPGVLDVHTAEVDWGDGSVEPAAVSETGGAGGIAATHLYTAAGTYGVSLCVRDDDGGSACAQREVTLVERFLDLAITKTVSPPEARPNQRVVYTLQVRNPGTLPAAGVFVSDPLPEHLVFVAANGGGSYSGGTVTWSLGNVAPGATVSRTLTVDVGAAAPFGAVVSNTAQVADNGASGPDGVPGNNQSTALLRVSDAQTPIVAFPTQATPGEGAPLDLAGTRWSDTTAGESHTGSVAWGDGATGATTLAPASGTSGAIRGSHVYAEDGSYPIELCVSDAAGHTGCTARSVTVSNTPPTVIEPGAVSLRAWQEEEVDGPEPSAEWVVAPDGLSVTQANNSRPSVFFSPLPAVGVFLEGAIQVGAGGNWDDDYIGFVLGFETGDASSATADFLLIDWKQANQDVARRGLAVSRVNGPANHSELWRHTGHVTELARAANLGDTGWLDRREYRFRFEYSRTRLRLWVDDRLEVDLEGDLPDGSFGFYNFSQENVRYRGFSTGLAQQFEGEVFEVRAPFSDPGLLDTHGATVDWDDGATGPAVALATEGFGFARATHDYPDDGDFLIEACVEDDDAGSDCGHFPLLVFNRPPAVTAGAGTIARVGVAAAIELAGFTDPGRLDSHTATVDWGDGAVEPAAVEEDGGAGVVRGTHTWLAAGDYVVEVCVTDDDGGSGCGSLGVLVDVAPPRLAAAKTVRAVDRDGDGRVSPGDELVYRIEIVNQGESPLRAVELVDPIPAHTRIVPGSVVPALLATSEDPVVVGVPELGTGASVVVQFAVTIDSPLPAGVREIVNSGGVTSPETGMVPTDDPDLPGVADPTRVPVTARSDVGLEKTAALVDLDGDGVATPGDRIEWRLTARAEGTTASTGIVVTDPPPAHTTLDPVSLVATAGEVVGVDPIVWVLEPLSAGAEAALVFRTAIDADLPAEIEEVANQATLASDAVDGIPSDDPSTPAPADPTRVPVYVLPTLGASAIEVTEGNAGTTASAFLLTLDRPSRLPVRVDWSLAGRSAVANEDFLPGQGTLTFAPGETSAVVPVAVIGDLLVEPIETFALLLSNPDMVRLASEEVPGLVIDDDTTALAVADAAVEEGSPAGFLLTLTAPSALPIEIGWTTADGTAQGGIDYAPASGVLTFAPLTTALTLSIESLEDELPEVDETFRVRFVTDGVAQLPDPEAMATLVDDDPTYLSIDDAAVVEGDAGTTQATLAVHLSRAHSAEVTVEFAARAGSALPDEDYLPAAGTIHFAPGETAAAIALGVVGETLVESDETLLVELSSPALADLADAVATLVILDDDAPECTLACPDGVAASNDAGRCGAAVALPPPAVTGGCGEASCTAVSGAFFPVGATLVTCSLPEAGLACSFQVDVTDAEPPAIGAPQLVVGNDPGLCGARVEFAAPVSDNCPDPGAAACDPPPGGLFAVGNTPVHCSALDAAGNVARAAGSVAVEDREPPRLAPCPADAGLAVPPGALSWPFEFETPAATDNCPDVAVGCAPASGSSFPLGVSTVLCTAVDGAGAASSCAFDVTLAPLAVAEIPALSRSSAALFALLMALSALALLRRRS